MVCLPRAGDPRFALGHEHVDLGPNAELFSIDAWFDCEAGAGNQPAVVVRLVVVHVDAVAVHLTAQAVAGPVDELRAEAGPVDHRPAGPVHFEAAQLPALPRRRLDQLDRGVPSGRDRRER